MGGNLTAIGARAIAIDRASPIGWARPGAAAALVDGTCPIGDVGKPPT